MSHSAHIPSHRKPRRSASKLALRAGVAGGVLSTIAVAGAAGPASAEPVTETIEMPTLNADLVQDVSSAVAASAEATQRAALDSELQAQENAAATKAFAEAKKAKAEADRKAEAERKAKEAEEKARAEAKERANRSTERTTLSASSGSSDSGSGSSASDDGGSSSSSHATGSAASIVDFVRAQVGDAYISGGTGPSSWDCSGLVQAAYRQIGVDLPRVSQDQSTAGTQVSLDNLQPGDILYWGGAGSAYHVGVYVGGGKFVGAQNPSTGVVERSLDYDMPSGAVRVL